MSGARLRFLRARFPVRTKDRAVVGAEEREAIFLRLEQDGKLGFGECAPLGSNAAASLDACGRALESWASSGAAADALASLAPPVRLAASAAVEMLKGFGSSRHPPVPAAAYFGAGPAALDEDSIGRLRRGAAIKVKVGRASPDEERRMLERIIREVPGTRLRLDGNRAMRLDDCVELVRGLPADRFEYLEEPVADPSDLAELHRRTGIAVALDELVLDPSAEARRLRDRLCGDRVTCAWVVRMSCIGSLDEVRRAMQDAASRGCDPVLSTAYESSWTIRLAAHLASACRATGRAHGLGTAGVLEADACAPATLDRGCVPCDPLPVPLEDRW